MKWESVVHYDQENMYIKVAFELPDKVGWEFICPDLTLKFIPLVELVF